jgi:hypothetical protein
MKYISAILLITILFSCKKQEIQKPVVEEMVSSIRGVETFGADLFIPEKITGWGYSYFGIRAKQPAIDNAFIVPHRFAVSMGLPEGQTIATLDYDCPIINIATQRKDGLNDFILPTTMGTYDPTIRGYLYEGVLGLSLFKNGLPVWNNYKRGYNVINTNRSDIAQDSLVRYYGADTTFISAQFGDVYRNFVPLPFVNNGTLIADTGKYLLVVHVNPQQRFTESNYSNNISTLPVTVGLNNTVVIDEAAIQANRVNSPIRITATANNIRGKKSVTLNMECPYHGTGVYHEFQIKKNGVIVQDDWYLETWTDNNVQGNPKNSIYEASIKIDGLQQSEFKRAIWAK